MNFELYWQVSDPEDINLDTETIQKYMLSVPHLSGATSVSVSTAPTATTTIDGSQCTVIPVQTLSAGTIAMDGTQTIIMPAIEGS